MRGGGDRGRKKERGTVRGPEREMGDKGWLDWKIGDKDIKHTCPFLKIWVAEGKFGRGRQI